MPTKVCLIKAMIFPVVMYGCESWTIKKAAAAKSIQSCPTVCDPIDGSPPGSAIPGILQARTLEWVAISFSIKKAESRKIDAFELWSPLDCKEIQPIHPKGDQSWVFIGRTDVEAETPGITCHNTCLKFSYIIILELFFKRLFKLHIESL